MMIEFSASINNKSVSEPDRAVHCPAAGHSGKTVALVVASEITRVQTRTSHVDADRKFHYRCCVTRRRNVVSPPRRYCCCSGDYCISTDSSIRLRYVRCTVGLANNCREEIDWTFFTGMTMFCRMTDVQTFLCILQWNVYLINLFQYYHHIC